MSKILILGGSGLLGTTLKKSLTLSGHNVISHGLSKTADITFDITNRAFALSKVSNLDPDIVINLVCLSNVDSCENNPHLAYLLNITPVEILSSWAESHSEKRIVHISTDHIYDGHTLSKEEDVIIKNMYGMSKYAAEHAAKKTSIVLRTNFFGKSGVDHRKSFSDKIILSLKNNEELGLFEDVFFSPLSMVSLAAFIELVMLTPVKGVYNLGSHKGMSKYMFGMEIARLLNLNSNKIKKTLSHEANLDASRPTNMSMDISKFEDKFNVELPTLKNEIKNELARNP